MNAIVKVVRFFNKDIRLATFIFLMVSSFSIAAQNWPSRVVTIVVPFPSGGTTDILARAIANKLSPALGQPVVIDYKPGAGATLGAAIVAKAAPDGYTLLMGAIHHTIATNVYRNLPYDFQKDFSPITVVASVPNVLVVNSKSPFNSVKDLVSAAKNSPNKYTYGSNGNGTSQHLIATQFQMLTGTEFLHVPYKGSAPLITDLLSGQVDMSFDAVSNVIQHINSGSLRPLVVISPKRSFVLPATPILAEIGYPPNLNIVTWFGLLAPAGTPKYIVSKLNSEVVKITNSPEFRKQMQDIGAEPVGNSSEEMTRQIKEETDRFSVLIKEGHVTIQ